MVAPSPCSVPSTPLTLVLYLTCNWVALSAKTMRDVGVMQQIVDKSRRRACSRTEGRADQLIATDRRGYSTSEREIPFAHQQDCLLTGVVAHHSRACLREALESKQARIEGWSLHNRGPREGL